MLLEDLEEFGEPCGMSGPCRASDELAVCNGAGYFEWDEGAASELDVGLAGRIGIEPLALDDSGGGENLREKPGIAALVFRELADKKIRMISQGASEINLTFVIEEDEVPDVIQRLHKTFFAELDPEVFA